MEQQLKWQLDALKKHTPDLHCDIDGGSDSPTAADLDLTILFNLTSTAFSVICLLCSKMDKNLTMLHPFNLKVH